MHGETVKISCTKIVTFCIYSENIFRFISSKLTMHVDTLQNTSELRFIFSKFKGYLLHKIILGQLQQKDSNMPSF
jgi:hypothetical protein